MSLSIDLDVEELTKKKFSKPVSDIFKKVARTTFEYIKTNSKNVAGNYGSPVLTGRFYTSHKVSLNSIDRSVSPKNPAGSKRPYNPLPMSTVDNVLSGWKLGDTLYIANSLGYARKIEYEGASWAKTPEGVYRVSVEAVKNRFKGGISDVAFTIGS